jgi:hypothetical protein
LDNEVSRVVNETKQAQNKIFKIDSIRVFAVFFALSLTLVASSIAIAAGNILFSEINGNSVTIKIKIVNRIINYGICHVILTLVDFCSTFTFIHFHRRYMRIHRQLLEWKKW